MCARNINEPKYEIMGQLERFDEADNAQARGDLQPGSQLWKDYYAKHPEFEDLSRSWLKLPGLGSIGSMPDRLMTFSLPITTGLMARDEDLDGEPAPRKIILTPQRATEKIKGFARSLGADLVRIGPLNQAWVYSHVGRARYPGKKVGGEIVLPHKSAIVIAKHLELYYLHNAPELGILIDVFKTYLQLAEMVVVLARTIRTWGYAARAHNLLNYQVILPPIAIDAGMGELGRNGILITEKYGSAIKIAAVTTDLPLIYDSPVDLGVDEFCRECKLCAKYCPVGAIPMHDEKRIVRGVRKWKINDNACYTYWRTVGTDCGICVSVCPWSRPRNFPHNLVAKAVERSGIARKIAIAADGLTVRKRSEVPGWMDSQPKSWKENLRKGHPWGNK